MRKETLGLSLVLLLDLLSLEGILSYKLNSKVWDKAFRVVIDYYNLPPVDSLSVCDRLLIFKLAWGLLSPSLKLVARRDNLQ
jgi:hypothetical protein